MNDRKQLVKAIAEDNTDQAKVLFEKLIAERLNFVLDVKKQELVKNLFTDKSNATPKR